MKRALFFAGLLVSVLLPQMVFAADEQIQAFDVVATMNRGNDLFVTEQISYDFGDQEKHGIYRYVPEFMVVSRRKVNIGLHWLGVLRDGKEDRAQESSASGNAVMKIGRPDQTITGLHEYRLNYSVAKSVVATPDGQRFTWNVTGNRWLTPIGASSFVLDGPIAPTTVTCFTGPVGSTAHDCTIRSAGSKMIAKTTRSLDPGEGWTIEAIYPTGTFIPAATQSSDRFPWLQPWMILALIFSVTWLLVWNKLGRDPKGRGTVIAEYNPPTGLKPYEVNAIDHDGGNHRGLAATILDLARRKAIRLTILDEGKNYRIERDEAAERKAGLDPYEVHVIEVLFATGGEFRPVGNQVERARAYRAMQSTIERELVNKGFHQWNVTNVRVLSFFAVFVTWGLGYYVTALYFADSQLWLSSIGLLIGLICAYYMPQRTRNGSIIREHIQGFKEYIRIAEKDRLAFHEAPTRTPERFSTLLPFAIALGIEKEWGSLFKDIALPTDQFGATSSLMYGNQLSGLAHHINSDMRSLAISSSSSGGGGGSSGGGGGGGGGGSW